MAINLKALNIGLGKGKDADKAPPSKAPAKKAPVQASSTSILEAVGGPKKKSPLAGKSFRVQAQVLLTVLGFLVFVIALVGWLAIRTTSNGAAYISASGQMRMLSQRIAKEAQQGLQGNTAAFARLKSSRDEFAGLLESVTSGGKVGDVEVPPTGESVKPMLDKVSQIWLKSDKNVGLVLAQQKNLISLGAAVKAINDNNPVLLDLAEQVSALKLQSQAGPREISAAGQLVMLTQRMAKNANALLASDVIDPEVTFLLGKDSNTFRDIVLALTKGSDALRVSAARDAETQEKLKELDGAYQEYRKAVNSILGNMQPLVNAKAAGRNVVNDSEALLKASDELAIAYEGELAQTWLNYVVMALCAAAAIVVGLLMAKAYRDENERRTAEQVRLREDSERLRSEAESQNKAQPGSHSAPDERDGRPRRRRSDRAGDGVPRTSPARSPTR